MKVYTLLSPPSHRKVCGPFGQVKQSHKQCSALMYCVLEKTVELCCLYVMAESDTLPCWKDIMVPTSPLHVLPNTISQVNAWPRMSSKRDNITIPSFLLVYSQLKHSLVVSFQISKVVLNSISWKCSIRSPVRRDIVNTHFQSTLRNADLKEEWCVEANRAVPGFSRDGNSRDAEAWQTNPSLRAAMHSIKFNVRCEHWEKRDLRDPLVYIDHELQRKLNNILIQKRLVT